MRPLDVRRPLRMRLYAEALAIFDASRENRRGRRNFIDEGFWFEHVVAQTVLYYPL